MVPGSWGSTAVSTNYNRYKILQKFSTEERASPIFSTHRGLRYNQNCCFLGFLSLHLSETCILKIHFSKWHNFSRGWGQCSPRLCTAYPSCSITGTCRCSAPRKSRLTIQLKQMCRAWILQLQENFKNLSAFKVKIKLGNFKISWGALFDQLELWLHFNLGISFIVQCKIQTTLWII